MDWSSLFGGGGGGADGPTVATNTQNANQGASDLKGASTFGSGAGNRGLQFNFADRGATQTNDQAAKNESPASLLIYAGAAVLALFLIHKR